MPKNNMLHNINRTLKVVLDDGRDVVGKLLVYDQHMNVVLSDASETRPQTKKMKQDGISPTRVLGLILLRGEHVVSVTVLKDSRNGAGEMKADLSHAPRSKKASAKRVREE